MKYVVIAEDSRVARDSGLISEYLGTYDHLRLAAHAIEEHCPLWKVGCPPVVLEWGRIGGVNCYIPDVSWVGGPVLYRVELEQRNTQFYCKA